MTAQPRGDEQARLAELEGLDLESRTGDPRLDQLARLAAELFEVPVALVTLIDEERQRFFARCGLEDLEGTPRDDAFCNHTIEADEVLVVPDAVLDDRFRSNPLVTGDPHIRFYAGAVLRGPEGYALGSFCLIDYVPRAFGQREQRRLVSVARVAESILRGGVSPDDEPVVERGALRDPATGLPQRSAIEERLGTILDDPVSPGAAVLVAHVEGLPELMNALGGPAGDSLLASLAERFNEALPRQASLGRWDSDEFVVVAPDVADADPDRLANALVDAGETSVSVGGQAARRSLSIGIAQPPPEGTTARRLVDQARAAARSNRCRRRGGSSISIGHGRVDTTRQSRVAGRLRDALAEGALVAHFQPRVAVADNRIVGAEALARWHDETLGWISPAEFVPMTERAGLVGELTARMIDAAVGCAARWRREIAPGFRVGVNLSASDLLDGALVERTRDLLAAHEAEGDLLEFEVTEGALVSDISRAVEQMLALRELGVRFAIDDFGTGYSSFEYLRQLPVDQLKIDRSFVARIIQDERDAAILQAICAMAQSLRLDTVAEGVELVEQIIFLKAYRCDQVQGFVHSPAVPASRFEQFLMEGFSDGPLGS